MRPSSVGPHLITIVTAINDTHSTTFHSIVDGVWNPDRDERPPIPDSVPDNVVKLIRDCWLKDRYARPSFAEILTRWDDIIVDNTIRDVAGRVLWKRLHALVRARPLFPCVVLSPEAQCGECLECIAILGTLS